MGLEESYRFRATVKILFLFPIVILWDEMRTKTSGGILQRGG